MSFTTCLLVAAGGAIGTLARYLISAAALPISQSLPWGTIGINILGSFIIGLFGTLTLANGRFPVSDDARLFVRQPAMMGTCCRRWALLGGGRLGWFRALGRRRGRRRWRRGDRWSRARNWIFERFPTGHGWRRPAITTRFITEGARGAAGATGEAVSLTGSA